MIKRQGPCMYLRCVRSKKVVEFWPKKKKDGGGVSSNDKSI